MPGFHRRARDEQRTVGLKRSAAERNLVPLERAPRDEIEGSRSRKIAELGEVGALSDLDALDDFRDEPVEIRVALAVAVAREVHRDAVDEDREVRAVIGVEPAQEILVRLAASLVLREVQA